MRMKRGYLKGLELGRTIGVEVEGYSGMYYTMTTNRVRHSELKYDGSLNAFGRYQGLEVATIPMTQLDLLDEVFEDITKYKWHCGIRSDAGTHIHVDASDYLVEDRFKMAIFMQKIEKAMFLLVKKARYSKSKVVGHRNPYCRPIVGDWKSVWDNLKANYPTLDLKSYAKVNQVKFVLARQFNATIYIPETVRYQYVNIWSSSCPTIEFRLFHAIRTSRDAKLFSIIAHNIVEIVKNSTIEHLDYLADVIMNQSVDSQDMIEKFSQAIGLEFTPKIYNKDLARGIDRYKVASRQVLRAV